MRRLFICALFAAFACVSASAAIPDRERAALLAIYNTTDGPHWSVQDWGDPPGNECNWYGVYCDDARSTVTRLDLGYVGAKGPVPIAVTDLANLEYLNFDGCDLSGPIPPELSTLSKLKELHLAYNEITGTIPPSLGSLSNLTTLHLSENALTGSIPPELGRLTQLQVLQIAGTNIGGPIPTEFSALSNLTELTLAYNKLTGPLPDFANWPHLETVQLQRNALTGTIPLSLAQLRSLTTLALSSNQLTGTIPKELGNLSLLTNLSLDDNQLTGTIPNEIYSLRRLTTLNLSLNQLTGQIAPAIGNLTALQYLFLDQNKLEGPIPAELMTLVNLQEIVLRLNGLSGPIPTNIDALTKLGYLGMSDNQLSGPIPPAIANLHELEVLDLSANLLTGTLPPQIGSMTALRHLLLFGNAFTGTIPDSYRNLTNLTELYLNRNQLSGPVPDWIGTLPNIDVLFLGDNLLTGTLPASITSASGLVYLDVGDNLLTGTLPADIGRLSNLYYLVIGGNDFTGPLPASIGDLKKLSYAILSRMNLSGPLPATLGGLASIDSLSLDENQFTGTIPPELGSLQTLEYLGLYGNRFTGTVPRELGRLKNLLQLDVSYNDLHAPLPVELEQLTKLTDGSSDFSFNALATNDPVRAAFVNRKHYDHDFGATQTVPPANVHVTQTTDRSATLEWTPIAYTYNEGGYQVRASLSADGPPVIYATTSQKDLSSITVRNLQPSTTYFFRVATVTHPHDYQQNLLVSDATAAVSATTGPRVLAPADVVFTATPGGLVQVDGKPINEDSFTLTNFGDVATSITLATGDQPFFTVAPGTFTLGPGASQTVKLTSLPQPPGVYYGYVSPQGDGVGADSSYVTIVLLSAPRAGGNAVAEAQTSRVDVNGLPGSDSVGSVVFRNRGTAALRGILTADVPWIVPNPDPIFIDAGSSALVSFHIVRARRPAGVADGTLTGTLSLIYVGEIPNNESTVHIEDTTPASISITKVTVVDSTKPDVGPANAPQLAAGEVAYFIAGLTSKNSAGSSLASDLHIGNSFGSKPVSDVRLYFTSATQNTVATLNAIGANQAVTLANVVSNVYGSSDAIGSLQVRSREWQSLTLNATLLRLITGAGTSAGDMPVFRSDRALRPADKMYLTGVRQSDSVHATLYLEDIAGVADAIHLDFLDPSGNAVATRDVSVPQFSTVEITDIPSAAVTIAATNTSTGTAAINAYVRMSDDASGDTWSVVDWDKYYAYTRTQPVRVALVAAAGSGGGKRRAAKHSTSIGTDATTPRTITSLSLFNSSNVEARATLRAGGVSKDVTIPVRQTMTIADAASFMGTSSAQSLVIDPQRGEIVATSRSSTQGASGGFVGTAVPLVSATRGLRVGQGQTFPGLEDSAAYRTDYGFVETGGSATTVRATLLLSDARSLFTTVISRDFTLAPNDFTLVNELVKSVLGSTRATYGDLHDLQLQIEVVDGNGSILPFVVVTDNTTGDQTLRLE